MSKKERNENVTTSAEPRFSKEQLVNCKQFDQHNIIIRAILKDGESYTIDEAKQLVNDYLKRRI